VPIGAQNIHRTQAFGSLGLAIVPGDVDEIGRLFGEQHGRPETALSFGAWKFRVGDIGGAEGGHKLRPRGGPEQGVVTGDHPRRGLRIGIRRRRAGAANRQPDQQARGQAQAHCVSFVSDEEIGIVSEIRSNERQNYQIRGSIRRCELKADSKMERLA
jgi:hypothetical protein